MLTSTAASNTASLAILPLDQTISVGVRMRPLTAMELERGDCVAWELDSKSGDLRQTRTLTPGKPMLSFPCDHMFGSSSTNAQIYGTLVHSIVESSMNGINGCVFAYGQTSSGKTYTIKGGDGDDGILPLALRQIFRCIGTTQNRDREFFLRVSYMELYNEQVKDLLSPGEDDIPVHETKERGFHILGLKEVVVTSVEQIFELLSEGELHRHFGRTNMNEESSRSHVIFRVLIESQPCRVDSLTPNSDNDLFSDSSAAVSVIPLHKSNPEKVRVSELNFVDLGGSERLTQTGAEGVRLLEGRSINKSLLFLGIVISKLSEGQSHIPFRDSKLTRILRSSLGGNSRTTIICCISPALSNQEHSVGTLRFGQRAIKVQQQAVVNEVDAKCAMIAKHQSQIQKLRQRLSTMLTIPEDEYSASCCSASSLSTAAAQASENAQLKGSLELKLRQLTRLILGANSINVPTSTKGSSVMENHRAFPRSLSWPRLLEVAQERKEIASVQDCLALLCPLPLSSEQNTFYRTEQLHAQIVTLQSRCTETVNRNKVLESHIEELKQACGNTQTENLSLTQNKLVLEIENVKLLERLDILERRQYGLDQMLNGVALDSADDRQLAIFAETLKTSLSRVVKYIHWSEFKHSPLVQSSISLELSGSEALSSGEQISLVCTKNDTLQQELQIALRRLSISESQIQELSISKSVDLNLASQQNSVVQALSGRLADEVLARQLSDNASQQALSEISALKEAMQRQQISHQETSLKLIKHYRSVVSITEVSDENSEPPSINQSAFEEANFDKPQRLDNPDAPMLPLVDVSRVLIHADIGNTQPLTITKPETAVFCVTAVSSVKNAPSMGLITPLRANSQLRLGLPSIAGSTSRKTHANHIGQVKRATQGSTTRVSNPILDKQGPIVKHIATPGPACAMDHMSSTAHVDLIKEMDPVSPSSHGTFLETRATRTSASLKDLFSQVLDCPNTSM